ncbi:HEAT repeat domain-containing protein [Paenibacillus profundus]|uniref:HEAT repeat domain-containing protein n=2 Tax=Paenibacillus profundus TaxID=1173085 RepID=A0ABS8YD68_9BACL|nr:HEAT repeat domain-containing protein [Paenibacillus profundus]
MVAPQAPSWNNKEDAWRKPAVLNTPIAEHEVMWKESWNWLSGQIGSIANTVTGNAETVCLLGAELEQSDEPAALNAAYELACLGQQGVEELLKGLRHDSIPVSRIAAYGLSAAGADAVPGLIAALSDKRKETIVHAVFALGELRQLASQSIPTMVGLLDHSSVTIRRTVVDALGMIETPAEDVVQGLIQCLHDTDVQVRFMTGLSLARLGSAAETAVAELEKALEDDNRYVRAHALEALRYIGTDQAKDVLIQSLFNSRWCSTTTAVNSFYP